MLSRCFTRGGVKGKIRDSAYSWNNFFPFGDRTFQLKSEGCFQLETRPANCTVSYTEWCNLA